MSPVQGKSPPMQVKKNYSNLDIVTCRLSSCNPECTKYILPIMPVIDRKNFILSYRHCVVTFNDFYGHLKDSNTDFKDCNFMKYY